MRKVNFSCFFPVRFRGQLFLTLTILLSLIILPSLIVGCIGYSLDQGGHGGSIPVAQPEDEIDPDKGNEEEEEQKRLEEERLFEEEKARLAIIERKNLEDKRKNDLGAFYVPLPPLGQVRDNPPVKARGLYLTGNTAGGHPRYWELLDLIEATELNAVVIDVKNDHGMVTYNTEIEIVHQISANKSAPIKDLEAVLEDLDSRDIYTIARVVVFKDPYLAEQKTQWAIQRQGGGVWRDRKGVAWINPYDKKVWDYNIAVAREAALMGFREIQFDYIRFPENAHHLDREAFFPGEDMPKDEIIREFLIYAAEQMKDYDVFLSADVFGVIATSWGDSDRIGQTWEEMSPYIDYICPMVYPSHYGPGYFGLAVPDAHPAKTVEYAMIDSIKRNATLENPAIIRPWLQSFTASWVSGNISYGPAEVRAQIETALKLGIDEYLIWNANNRYMPASYLSQEEFEKLDEKYLRSREESGKDVLGRTAQQAVEAFLEAINSRNWREAFALQITGYEMDHRDYPEWKNQWVTKPVFYEIEPIPASGLDNPIFINLEVHLTSRENEYKLHKERWEVRQENLIWRVKPSPAFVELLTSDRHNNEENPPG
jgi:hypothetical protein